MVHKVPAVQVSTKEVLIKRENDVAGKSKLLCDDGFSTVGMVLALLITLSLIFSSAQVYQVNSASATIQNIADAAALAAENEVAEFYIVAQLCDALILSLSLTGIATIGLGIVALCIPATAALSEKLIKAGNDILDSRNSFAEKAAEGLNALQKLLPFISAVNAESVVSANSGGPMNASYGGVAILLPFEGEEITVGSCEAADELSEDVDENSEEIKEAAEKAEEAAEKAREEKERAFAHDCGRNPSYCMYERAGSLSSISEMDNPLYQSADTWDFSVALKRAQSYYPLRLAAEEPTDTSIESQADSALRKRFYTYAVDELSKGYVLEEETGAFSAYFPILPKNTAEMKETVLYTESVYPLGIDSDGEKCMHAWSGCPVISSQEGAGTGSLAQLDSETFKTCSSCEFTVSSFGKIAAASSTIENGFEYHYRIVAECAQAYQKAREEYAPLAEEVKSLTEGLFEKVKKAFSEAASYRINPAPPGRIGVVALVVNTTSVAPSTNFASNFVDSQTNLGAQVAISAATLVEDSPEEGSTVLSSLLDGLSGESQNWGLDLLDGVLDLWSSLLFAYTQGQQAIEEGIASALDSVPLASESGLGTWAAAAFSDLVEMVGLEPANLASRKPALVNTAHVLMADDSNFSAGLIEVKQSYLALEGNGSGGLFSDAVSHIEAAALESVDDFGDEIVIASIELLGEEGPSIPLTISLPASVKGVAKGFIADIIDRLRGVESSLTGLRRWE